MNDFAEDPVDRQSSPSPDDDPGDRADLEADQGSSLNADPTSSPAVECWRCHLEYARELVECPHCGATNRFNAADRRELRKAKFAESQALKIVLVTYGVMLAGSILLAIFARFGLDPQKPDQDPSEFNGAILSLEIVHTIVVVIALSITGLAWARVSPALSTTGMAIGWLVFLAGLPLMIGGNFLYHQWLTELLNAPAERAAFGGTWIVLLFLYCLQPAIIEEIFSRQLCLAAFRPLMGIHFAIIISAVMFSMMHIFVPLSVPYLFLLGVYLGYARVYGGSLFLPIVLHFIHNLVVIYLEKTA